MRTTLTAMTDEPATIVFDTEPLVAYFHDEPGSDTVEEYIEAINSGADGFISRITQTEIHYLTARIESVKRADLVVEVIAENGIRTIGCEDTWHAAAIFKQEYATALGDAFSLAAAEHVEGMLIVGADDDFDEITEVDIERFRTKPV